MSACSSKDWEGEIAAARNALVRGDLTRVVGMLDTAPFDVAAPIDALKLLASALQRLGRARDVAAVHEVLVRRQPGSAVAEHNLAAALGDGGFAAESERAARRALAKGGRAPETWQVLGRALMAQVRLDEADAAFREALGARPDFLAGFRDLAQLCWMRSADLDQLALVIEPLRDLASVNEAAALLLSSILRDTAGDQAALVSLEPWIERPYVDVALAAAAAASGVDPQLALQYAYRAANLSPTDPRTLLSLASALVASGRAPEAHPLLEGHLRRDPNDQYARALLTTVWRLTDDDRALKTTDYERLVRMYDLKDHDDDQEGAWLIRAAAALRRLHPFRSHPFQQSVRHGAQSTIDPRVANDPDINRLFEKLADPIADYLRDVRPDLGGRDAGVSGKMTGAWSVKLPAGGSHTDHVHARAWVSSAVYVETPPAVKTNGREGWLRFGAARIGASFTLPAEYWIQPTAGTVVLFPSWLWHGTEPFTGAGERLTVAFDLLPEGKS